MKKLMFTLAMFAVALTSANAQKQLGGEHNLEVSFNPFGGNPIDASVIKYRKFLDDDAALRVTIGMDNTSNSYLVAPENSLQEFGASGTLTHPDLFLSNNHSRVDLGMRSSAEPRPPGLLLSSRVAATEMLVAWSFWCAADLR